MSKRRNLDPATAPGTNEQIDDLVGRNGPPAETKAAKFVRLANRRVPAALKRIALVGNLGSCASYEYTPEQGHKILTALQSAVDAVTQEFSGLRDEKSVWEIT